MIGDNTVWNILEGEACFTTSEDTDYKYNNRQFIFSGDAGTFRPSARLLVKTIDKIYRRKYDEAYNYSIYWRLE